MLKKFFNPATLVAIGYTLMAGVALAAGTSGFTSPGGSVPLENPLGTSNIADLLDRIIGYLILIAVPIVAIMVIVGAFQMLFSAGDPEKFSNGKKTILYAAIGFAIILLAKGLTAIVSQLLGAGSSSAPTKFIQPSTKFGPQKAPFE